MIKENTNSFTNKEQLIGLTWKCGFPECNKTEIVTEEGIYHVNKNHLRRLSLDEIWKFLLFEREMHQKELELWFGNKIPFKH